MWFNPQHMMCEAGDRRQEREVESDYSSNGSFPRIQFSATRCSSSYSTNTFVCDRVRQWQTDVCQPRIRLEVPCSFLRYQAEYSNGKHERHLASNKYRKVKGCLPSQKVEHRGVWMGQDGLVTGAPTTVATSQKATPLTPDQNPDRAVEQNSDACSATGTSIANPIFFRLDAAREQCTKSSGFSSDHKMATCLDSCFVRDNGIKQPVCHNLKLCDTPMTRTHCTTDRAVTR